MSLGFTILGEMFACVTVINPTMKIRIFGVRAKSAQTRPRFILSCQRVLGEWSQNPCKLQGENPFYRKNSPQRSIEPTTLHQAGQRAQHTTNELFRPLLLLCFCCCCCCCFCFLFFVFVCVFCFVFVFVFCVLLWFFFGGGRGWGSGWFYSGLV